MNRDMKTLGRRYFKMVAEVSTLYMMLDTYVAGETVPHGWRDALKLHRRGKFYNDLLAQGEALLAKADTTAKLIAIIPSPKFPC